MIVAIAALALTVVALYVSGRRVRRADREQRDCRRSGKR